MCIGDSCDVQGDDRGHQHVGVFLPGARVENQIVAHIIADHGLGFREVLPIRFGGLIGIDPAFQLRSRRGREGAVLKYLLCSDLVEDRRPLKRLAL
ncbi:hypothetical protein D3C76_1617330 [compost metagenome]